MYIEKDLMGPFGLYEYYIEGLFDITEGGRTLKEKRKNTN